MFVWLINCLVVKFVVFICILSGLFEWNENFFCGWFNCMDEILRFKVILFIEGWLIDLRVFIIL